MGGHQLWSIKTASVIDIPTDCIPDLLMGEAIISITQIDCLIYHVSMLQYGLLSIVHPKPKTNGQ